MKETKLTKEDWQRSKSDNIGLIVNNKMQIQMAEKVIELCDERIAKFEKNEEYLDGKDCGQQELASPPTTSEPVCSDI